MLQLNAEQLELLEADTSQFQQYFTEARSSYNSRNSTSTKTNNERLQLLVQQMPICKKSVDVGRLRDMP